jgi:hypothetical protein
MINPGQKPEKEAFNKWQMVSLALELGFIIALPLIVLGSIGKWLDQRFSTEPWLTLLSIFLSIAATTFWIAIKVKPLMK